MTLTSIEAIIAALNRQEVRYLVVGGLAVAAHGHGRLTIDLDLVIELKQHNVEKTILALETLGYIPAVPVRALDFADPTKRQEWMTQKNMVVFSLRSEQHSVTPVDIFVSEPFDFNTEYGRALVTELGRGEKVRFVCLETLIQMKEAAGRGKDQEDVKQLKLLLLENADEL